MPINDPILYYTMDNADIAGINITDRGSGGNNGTLEGSPTTGSIGKIAQAITFDGSSQYISAPSSASLRPTSMTIAAWVKLTGTLSTNAMIVEGEDLGYELVCDDTGKVWWATSTNFAINLTSYTLVANQWTHLVLTYDETTGANVYANGINVATDTATGAITYTFNTDTTTIGSRGGSLWFFPGSFDEVRIYGRPLSPSEVTDLYNFTGSSFAAFQAAGIFAW